MVDEYIENWLKKAESDLRIVDHELKLPEDETVKDLANQIKFLVLEKIKPGKEATGDQEGNGNMDEEPGSSVDDEDKPEI